MSRDTLQSRLLNWYRKNKRTLPWRDHSDPYVVWVSEIMLQQTRVETVIPYFENWMETFPSIHALANASEHKVLNAWEGLGYYSRARNMYKAAKIIVNEYGGNLPREVGELIELPGIGRYTAGAIASIVFGADEPALDGNLKRVYSRLFNLVEPIDSVVGEKKLWEIARTNILSGRAGDFNQALMDLGAMICLLKNPRCDECPVMRFCLSYENGTQEDRPVRKPKKEIPHHIHAAGVVLQNGKVLLAQRPGKGLLARMWEFPNGRVNGNPARGLVKVLESGYRLKVQRKEALGAVQHTYTHFKVTVHAFLCTPSLAKANGGLRWVKVGDLDEYPMGKMDRQIALKLSEYLSAGTFRRRI